MTHGLAVLTPAGKPLLGFYCILADREVRMKE